MRLRVSLFFFVMVLIVGKQANGSEPALPDELMKVKTLCLDVRAAVRVPVYDKPSAKWEKEASKLEETASEALKKWGRFAVVPSCGSADGVLLLRTDPGNFIQRGAFGPSYANSPLNFSIVSQRSRKALYQTLTPDCQSSRSCIKAEINTLRKKMEKQGN